VSPLPARLRRLAPDRVRDDVRLRALAVGLGVIPPRTMHSQADVGILRQAASGARVVVEIGVFEGGSALALCDFLPPEAELHLVDPFGRQPDALPGGWGASEWATRRVLARAVRRAGAQAPEVCWHVARSHEVATSWSREVDLVFIDGDHSEAGCELDWSSWHRFVAPGGYVVFHDARAGLEGGRGLPGPTAVVARRFRGADASSPGWAIAGEADRTVAVRRLH
jgi:predicted O-methyltransferase YrrM